MPTDTSVPFTNEEDTLRAQVARWVEEAGLDYTEIEEDEEEFRWHLSINWPPESNWNLDLLELENEPGCLQIFVTVDINENHQEGLRNLSDDERVEFQQALVDELMTPHMLFSIAVSGPDEEDTDGELIAERFVVQALAFEDGINKTVFFDKLLHVHTARMNGVLLFQRSFGRTEAEPDEPA